MNQVEEKRAVKKALRTHYQLFLPRYLALFLGSGGWSALMLSAMVEQKEDIAMGEVFILLCTTIFMLWVGYDMIGHLILPLRDVFAPQVSETKRVTRNYGHETEWILYFFHSSCVTREITCANQEELTLSSYRYQQKEEEQYEKYRIRYLPRSKILVAYVPIKHSDFRSKRKERE